MLDSAFYLFGHYLSAQGLIYSDRQGTSRVQSSPVLLAMPPSSNVNDVVGVYGRGHAPISLY